MMTFSVGFEDQPEEKGHEFEYSDLVADLYGTRHQRFITALPPGVCGLPLPVRRCLQRVMLMIRLTRLHCIIT